MHSLKDNELEAAQAHRRNYVLNIAWHNSLSLSSCDRKHYVT